MIIRDEKASNGDWIIYRDDVEWYRVTLADRQQWAQQSAKIEKDMAKSRLDWDKSDAEKRFHAAVQADLAAQASRAGFVSRIKPEDYNLSYKEELEIPEGLRRARAKNNDT